MPLPGHDRFVFAGRHYVEIAKVMNSVRPKTIDSPEFLVWCSMVESLATMFETDNERFDKVRFTNACIDGVDNT